MPYYVVWVGAEPGIYDNWNDCRKRIIGFPGARYKKFNTLAEAEEAFGSSRSSKPKAVKLSGLESPIQDALAVDAACSGNPGVMEYRGVHVGSRQEWFNFKIELGTNNIGEFLGIVHGLAFQKQHDLNIPIYSDSQIAIGWIKAGKCKTKLAVNEKTKKLFEVIRRAEEWLAHNSWDQPLLKWETKRWGEIPADFGRK